MMTRQPCWVDSNNKPHFTREECQASEIAMMLAGEACDEMSRSEVADWIVKNIDAVVNVLTTNETSRPGARKANGATKKRKPKVIAALETAV